MSCKTNVSVSTCFPATLFFAGYSCQCRKSQRERARMMDLGPSLSLAMSLLEVFELQPIAMKHPSSSQLVLLIRLDLLVTPCTSFRPRSQKPKQVRSKKKREKEKRISKTDAYSLARRQNRRRENFVTSATATREPILSDNHNRDQRTSAHIYAERLLSKY